MFDFFNLKPAPLVGIDIGSSSIKLLEIQKKNDTYHIPHAACCYHDLPLTIKQSDKEMLAKSIHTLVEESGTECRSAAISVSGPDVVIRRLQVDGTLSENETVEHLQYLLDQILPFAIEEGYYDFQIIGPSDSNPQLNDILFAAARRNQVDFYVNALDTAGLKVTKVDITSLAMNRAYCFLAKELSIPAEDTVALIDIGAARLTIQVIRNSQSIYTREDPSRILQLIDELKNHDTTSRKEITSLLKQSNVSPIATNDVIIPFGRAIMETIYQILHGFHPDFTNEIQHLILTGGWSFHEGLRTSIQTYFRINTLTASSLCLLGTSEYSLSHFFKNQTACFIPSLGLALRTFDEFRY
jgi:type IV pilus assembly protein PilM